MAEASSSRAPKRKSANASAAPSEFDRRAKMVNNSTFDEYLAKMIEENEQTRPDYCRKLEESRIRHKEFLVSQKKLSELHLKISEEQALFVKERKKWVADRRLLRSADMNQYFVERCQWETEFKENHLKPLYEERHIAAQGYSHFWSFAMLYDRQLYKQITVEDGKVLECVNNIVSSRTSNLKGFELKFTFNDNPWFNNKVLTKTYEVTGDNDSASLKAIGTKIDWKPSHNLTEKKRGKHSKSFFNFFKSYATVDPLSFDIEADKLKGDLPEDYEIGIKIRDKIIPWGFVP